MFGHALMVLGITSALAGGPPLLDEPYAESAEAPASRSPDASGGATSHMDAPGPNESWSSLSALCESLATDIARQLAPRPRLSGRALYLARTEKYAMARFWVGGAIDRLLHFLTPASRIPLLGFAQFDVLGTVPVVGEHSSDFGYRVHPISGRRKLHSGLDFAADRHTPVRAAGPGEVKYAKRRGTYGNLVIISHGLGLETRYAHLHRIRTTRDTFVTAGQIIGTVGSTGRSTGPHLHFEVRQFGEPVDPKWAMGLRTPTLADELSAMWRWLVDN